MVLYALRGWIELTIMLMYYRKPGSTSASTSIQRLRICAVRIAWGTYNHGVLLNEGKKYSNMTII